MGPGQGTSEWTELRLGESRKQNPRETSRSHTVEGGTVETHVGTLSPLVPFRPSDHHCKRLTSSRGDHDRRKLDSNGSGCPVVGGEGSLTSLMGPQSVETRRSGRDQSSREIMSNGRGCPGSCDGNNIPHVPSYVPTTRSTRPTSSLSYGPSRTEVETQVMNYKRVNRKEGY